MSIESESLANEYTGNLEIIAHSKHFYSEIKLLFALKRKKPCIYIPYRTGSMHEELQDKIFVFGYEQYVNEVHILYDVLWYKMILFANKQKIK